MLNYRIYILAIKVGLQNNDINEIKDYLSNNEADMAFEVFCSIIVEDSLPIMKSYYDEINAIGQNLSSAYVDWNMIERLREM